MVRANKLLNPALHGVEADLLEAGLRSRIVGQEDAIRQIVGVYQMHLAGLASPARPVGNFLLLGPTGTGKTRIVEAVAESLMGDPRAMVKIDCAEFQHSHEIAKLIGSPPGYLGHRETHPALSQELLNKHFTDKVKLSIVLFDEIEKASDALWNLLLGILDKATLTLGDNRQVDFSRAIIFMTSNLGAKEMTSMLAPSLGFVPAPGDAGAMAGQVERAAIEAARRKFSPEFLNRIDKVLVFRPLGESELHRILDLELDLLRRRFIEHGAATRFSFSVSEPAKGFLLEEGTDARYGARYLKRTIERLLVSPISNLVASAQIESGDAIRVDLDAAGGRLLFYKEEAAVAVGEREHRPRTPEKRRAGRTAATVETAARAA